eukprot:gene7191-7033_t
MDTRWKPNVTVAAIIERDGRYLLIEEHTQEGLRLNNPAGHLDPGESPAEGCAREALEETAHPFTPTALVGVYLSRFQRPATGEDITYLRMAFCGSIGDMQADRPLDSGIVRTLWMTPEEIRDSAAALGAGVLNAIAGGGSFLTFPALVFAGVPPLAANATSAMAVSPGYLGSTLGFRAEIQALPRSTVQREVAVAALGGLMGAGLLLVTPARLFSGLVPWLLLLATLLFAAGPWLAKRNQGQGHPAWRLPSLLGVAIYGGYFNGGLGILLMALYTLTGEQRLNTVNALKNLNSFVLSLLSVAAFAVAGAIVWPQAVWMMALATLGGWAGARLAKRLPVQWVRWLVIGTGLVMSAVFFSRLPA